MGQLYYCEKCNVLHDGKHRCKKHKYNAHPQQDDEGYFASSREQQVWYERKMLERAGLISDLQRQVSFDLTVNSILIARYRTDHVYIENGKYIVEDVKGVKTEAYRMKKNLMLACHGIRIREVS